MKRSNGANLSAKHAERYLDIIESLTLAELRVRVRTSFIKINKALTKFNEALTKPYHGLVEILL